MIATKQMLSSQTGVSFIEIMVVIAIFSISIISIFSIFISAAERINYMTNRLYAMNILDNRISNIGVMLRVYKALPIDMSKSYTVDICGRKTTFKEYMSIHEVEDYVEVFKLELALIWPSAAGKRRAALSSYISDFTYLSK